MRKCRRRRRPPHALPPLLSAAPALHTRRATACPAAGHVSYTTLRKHALVSELQLRHRDIRALDPAVQLPCERLRHGRRRTAPSLGDMRRAVRPCLELLPWQGAGDPAAFAAVSPACSCSHVPAALPASPPPTCTRPQRHLHPQAGHRAEPRGPEAAHLQVRRRGACPGWGGRGAGGQAGRPLRPTPARACMAATSTTALPPPLHTHLQPLQPCLPPPPRDKTLVISVPSLTDLSARTPPDLTNPVVVRLRWVWW